MTRLGCIKASWVLVFCAWACCAGAQANSGGSGAAKAPPAKSAPKQAPDQQGLGFGSNIENARLARAAELALKAGDKVKALDFARRAAEAAPADSRLWFLVGYAARLNGRGNTPRLALSSSAA